MQDELIERLRARADYHARTGTPNAGNLELEAATQGTADNARVLAPGFQAEVGDWMLECFNPEIADDQLERADRFTEEALELAQTMPGFSAERAHALVDYVFSRPVGERGQEVGGVMVALAALCNPVGLSIRDEAERELARVWTKVEAIRAKQASKPVGSALPVARAILERTDIDQALADAKAEGAREVVQQIRDADWPFDNGYAHYIATAIEKGAHHEG